MEPPHSHPTSTKAKLKELKNGGPLGEHSRHDWWRAGRAGTALALQTRMVDGCFHPKKILPGGLLEVFFSQFCHIGLLRGDDLLILFSSKSYQDIFGTLVWDENNHPTIGSLYLCFFSCWLGYRCQVCTLLVFLLRLFLLFVIFHFVPYYFGPRTVFF